MAVGVPQNEEISAGGKNGAKKSRLCSQAEKNELEEHKH